MNNEFRREPTYTDTDVMPFGKHKNECLGDVPAAYLGWLWTQRPISDKKLENYIWNSQDAIEMEIGKKLSDL